MKQTARLHLWPMAALVALACGWASPASAGEGAVPRLVIRPSALSFWAPGDARTLTLTNAGNDVLRIGGVSIVSTGARRGSDFAVDAPGPRELEPGASATLTVTYRPPPGAVPPQAFAALLLPADDPELPLDLQVGTGAPVARRVASVALRAGEARVLSWMILLPLLGAALLLGAPARRARALALAAAMAPLVVAGCVIARFDPSFSIADGNDGFQLVAHAPLVRAIGFEYFVGVDGVSLLFVLLAPIVGAVAVWKLVQDRTSPATREDSQAFAAALAVQAGATGVFVALDGFLLAVFWALAAVGLVRLAGPRARAVGVAALASAALLVLALVVLRGQTNPTYLIDGTPAAHTLDLAKLSQVAAFPNGKGALLLLSVVVVALGIALPLVPFSTPLASPAPAALRLLLAGLFSKMAIYGLARLGVGVQAEAMRAASTALLVLGVLGGLRAALLATRADALDTLAARAGDFHASVMLIGLASLAPAGIAGALALAFAHGLVAALLGALEPAPRARGVVIGSLAASLGAPGLAPFAGLAFIVFDAAPRHPGVAIAVLLGFAILTGAHARLGARLVSTAPAAIDPPDAVALRRRTLFVVAPLAALVLALGLVPTPLFASIATGALDLAHLAAR
jgi:NADH-quinone oxidoreductase subunit M